ncbi:MAG: Holliday junction branch migration protein RuvA [Deltaproteobacteria bacterium]|jgi:Holliday junction DNA helicase RuvA|nr:MAG: Holliday junction branch migration protein RuvA [Deltaproteobacteria bacterium]
MIAHIQGRLYFKSPEHLIIDVDGIGYQVHVPLTTFYELPDVGNTVALHIHTHVREDALQLYGFQAQEEKALFIRLMGVAGIGPRLAVNILSGISPAELAESLLQGDLARLISIPGVGRKTAERIMVEMRDKLPALAADRDIALSVKNAAAEAVIEDAISALINLGYKKGLAQRAIDQAQQRLQGEINLERLLKESLRSLA